ncbi:MAG: citrate synthase [Marteilia pararefringens]
MMRKLGPISNFSYTLMRQTRTISYGSASNFQERLKVHSQFDPLFLKITENVSVQRQAMAQLKANTTKFVQSTNIGNVINGMKGITGLLCDTSLLDPNSGITFHGKTLKQTLRDLPKLENSKFASPEALYYYLLTKSVPSVEDVKKLSNLILSHYRLPDHTLQVLFDLRKSHPMHQFIAAMASLATESHLASEYVNIPKNEYWKLAYLDSIELLGKAASICGIVSLHAHRLHDAVFTNQDLTPQSNSASAGSASRDLAEYYMSIAAPIGGPEYKGEYFKS